MNLIAVLIVAIAISTSGTADTQKDFGNNQQLPANNQAQASPTPAGISKPRRDKGQQTNRNGDGHKNKFLAWCDRYKSIADFFSASLVALFTAILTVYTVKAWRTSKQELRAYVGVEATGFKESVEKGVTQAQIVIKNSGQTPAFDFRINANFYYYTLPRTEFPLSDELKGQSTATLNPGQIVNVPLIYAAMVTDTTRREINAGEAAFFLYGRMEYRDAFHTRRYANFRYIADNDIHAGGTLRWRATEEGNEAN
jgi:hypothetical protein